MAGRIWGGIAGWLAAVLPLLAVNTLEYFGMYYFPDPVIAGLVALVGGLILGGPVAALIGARRGRVAGAAVAGVLAAILYSVSMIGLLYVSRALDASPSVLSQHPLRVSAAILFFAALLLLVSLVTGAVAVRRAEDVPLSAASAATSQRRGPVPASVPSRRLPATYPAAPSRPLYGPPAGARERMPSQDRSGAPGSTTRPRTYAPPQPARPVRGMPASASWNDDADWRDSTDQRWH